MSQMQNWGSLGSRFWSETAWVQVLAPSLDTYKLQIAIGLL